MINPGDPSGSPDDFSNLILFIDNAYLLRLRNHFFKGGLKYSIKKLATILSSKLLCDLQKIFLYDAPPFQSPSPSLDEKKRKESYDKFTSYLRKDGIIVKEGRTQRIKVGNDYVFRQKGVDMLMGIDMVSIKEDLAEVQNAAFISGDSDFVPVIKKLMHQKINVILFTYFERNRKSPFSKSNELLRSLNYHFIKITKEDFEKAKLS